MGLALRQAIQKGDIESIQDIVISYKEFIPITWSQLIPLIASSPTPESKDPRIISILYNHLPESQREYADTILKYDKEYTPGKILSNIESYGPLDILRIASIGRLGYLPDSIATANLIHQVIEEYVYDPIDKFFHAQIANRRYIDKWIIENGYFTNELAIAIYNDDLKVFKNKLGDTLADDGLEEFIESFDAYDIFRYLNHYSISQLASLNTHGRILAFLSNFDVIEGTFDTLIWTIEHEKQHINMINLMHSIISNGKDKAIVNQAYKYIVSEQFLELIDEFLTQANMYQFIVYGIKPKVGSSGSNSAKLQVYLPKPFYQILFLKGYDAKGISQIINGELHIDMNILEHLLIAAARYESERSHIFLEYLLSQYGKRINIKTIGEIILNMKNARWNIGPEYTYTPGEEFLSQYLPRMNISLARGYIEKKERIIDLIKKMGYTNWDEEFIQQLMKDME